MCVFLKSGLCLTERDIYHIFEVICRLNKFQMYIEILLSGRIWKNWRVQL